MPRLNHPRLNNQPRPNLVAYGPPTPRWTISLSPRDHPRRHGPYQTSLSASLVVVHVFSPSLPLSHITLAPSLPPSLSLPLSLPCWLGDGHSTRRQGPRRWAQAMGTAPRRWAQLSDGHSTRRQGPTLRCPYDKDQPFVARWAQHQTTRTNPSLPIHGSPAGLVGPSLATKSEPLPLVAAQSDP